MPTSSPTMKDAGPAPVSLRYRLRISGPAARALTEVRFEQALRVA